MSLLCGDLLFLISLLTSYYYYYSVVRFGIMESQDAVDLRYGDTLRNFVKTEFRSEMNDATGVTLSCLICQGNPNPSCLVCYPNRTGCVGNDTNKAKDVFGISKYKVDGKYVDITNNGLTSLKKEQKRSLKKQKEQDSLILELRLFIENMENEREESNSVLRNLSTLCLEYKTRLAESDERDLDYQSHISDQDLRIQELETLLAGRDEELKSLKKGYQISEACRSQSAKLLGRMRRQKGDQAGNSSSGVYSGSPTSSQMMNSDSSTSVQMLSQNGSSLNLAV